jgi:hypothetical protein
MAGTNLMVMRLKVRETMNEVCPELFSLADDLIDGYIHRSVEEFSRFLPHLRREVLKSAVYCHRVKDTTRVVTAPKATDNTSLCKLVDDEKNMYNSHIPSPFCHKKGDTINSVTAPSAGIDVVKAIVLANDLKEKFNNHRTEPLIHYSPDLDNQISLPDAGNEVDLAIDIANEFKESYNKHLAQKADGRIVCIGDLPHLMQVQGVEYPAGKFPPCFVPYQQFPLVEDALKMLIDTPPTKSNEDIAVYYDSYHIMDIFTSTIPLGLEPVLLDAIIAYICFAEVFVHLKLSGVINEEATVIEALAGIEILKADAWEAIAGITLVEAKLLTGAIFTDMASDLTSIANSYTGIAAQDISDAHAELARASTARDRAGGALDLARTYHEIGIAHYNRFLSAMASDISEFPLVGEKGAIKFREKVNQVRLNRRIIPTRPYIARIQ